MFIQTEATPATLKVFPGRVVMEEGTFEARGVARLPLARPPRRTCRDSAVYGYFDLLGAGTEHSTAFTTRSS